MTREEIIDGLKFTIEMFLLDPITGETITEPRNDMDKTTIDACRGAIELLEQEPKVGHWIKIKPYPLQMHDYRCSECGHETDDNAENYCSECGTRMVGVQKRRYKKYPNYDTDIRGEQDGYRNISGNTRSTW